MLVVISAFLVVKINNKLVCDSQTTAVHVTIVISAHAVARMLSLHPLWNPSALLASPLVVPGAPALDVKSTAGIMIIAAPQVNRLQNDLQGTASVVLPGGSVRPAARSSQIPLLMT